MTSQRRPPARGGAALGASALGLGSMLNGLLAYIFFATVTRALGAEAAAPVSVLWAWWGFAGAALTFPIQHWIARTVALHEAEAVVHRQVGRVAAAVTGVAAAAGTAAWLLRDQLFRDDGVLFPLMVAAVALGSALLGFVRGTLTARRRFGAVGAGLVAENGLRCLAAVALLVAGVDDPAAYGGCLVAGYLTAALWPHAFRLADDARDGADVDPGRPPSGPLAFVGGVATGQAAAQAVLTGGPVLLALAGGAAGDVTALFAALALFRAPYTFSLGMVAPLTARLTAMVAADDVGRLARFRGGTLVATLVAAAVAAPVGALLGPPVMALVFGDDVRLGAGLTTLVAIGSAFALGNLVLTVLLIARGRTSVLLRGWLAAIAMGALLFALSGWPATERTCWTFLLVEVAACGWLASADVRAARRP